MQYTIPFDQSLTKDHEVTGIPKYATQRQFGCSFTQCLIQLFLHLLPCIASHVGDAIVAMGCRGLKWKHAQAGACGLQGWCLPAVALQAWRGDLLLFSPAMLPLCLNYQCKMCGVPHHILSMHFQNSYKKIAVKVELGCYFFLTRARRVLLQEAGVINGSSRGCSPRRVI